MNELNLYIIYYNLKTDETRQYKSIIKACSRKDAKVFLFKKIDRDFLVYNLSKVRAFKINQNSYRGRRLSDKQMNFLEKVSYPNSKHKLFKYEKDDWFKSYSPSREENGTFKKGFTPWNKDLKMKVLKQDSDGKFSKARDENGQFLEGIKSIVVGSKNSNEKKETK